MLTVTEGRPRAEVADRLGVADDAEVVVRSRRYRTPRTHRSDQDAQTNAGEVVRQFQTMCTTVASELHGTRPPGRPRGCSCCDNRTLTIA